ncbi:transposable element Tcb1 transposase [Trichonephila clavipes]|nr:transposable element Tcb1 transposase [Trichonephila clavipes]
MSRRKQRSAFNQVSEFDRGRARKSLPRLRLSFREIDSRVGRNQTTVKQICNHWMQEGTTERRDRSHPPQCTTLREDRQNVRMAMTCHSVTSRTVSQHIESVTHHSVSARTIRRRLQQSGLSARRPLIGLPLTQNHRCLRGNWAMKEGCGWQNGMKLSLLTSHASVCNTTMVGFESGDTAERRC